MQLIRNKTPFIGPTIITAQDKQEFQMIMRDLPENYRQLLQGKPYSDCNWFIEANQLMIDCSH